LRDAKQAEVLLNQQENFLSKEDVPVSFLFHPPRYFPRVSILWYHYFKVFFLTSALNP
jgi:hypothetical protein